MFEKLEQCPLCKGTEFNNFLICKDFTVSGESFAIVACADCSFTFTNPRPAREHLSEYYQSDDYISHTNKTRGLTDILYKTARYFTIKKKLRLVNNLAHEKSILDFGCGTGVFLSACKKNGWKINGFEPEKNARQQADTHIIDNITPEFNDLYKIDSVNVITLWHVLEHISDLNEAMLLFRKKLQKDGSLIIAVPNYKSYDAQYYKEYWAAYDVPRHLYHFSKDTMKKLLKNHGFKLKDILPMKLDSYYVSMLSEKYKNGHTNYLKSIITGYKSNSYAKKNNEYSSLIYIAGK